MTTTEPRAHLVVDLGFGDAGKGLLTDALVRRTGARLVVRFNGGAQAGHTVVTDDGRTHTFAQVGAGSFVPGVATLLAAPVVVHPTALGVEARVLAAKGVSDVLSRVLADARCRVVTPYHQATNRLRELARGSARHGSCGVGVGETVTDALTVPADTITLGLLRDPGALRRVLARVRARKREEVGALEPRRSPAWDLELRIFDDDDVLELWVAQATAVTAAITVVDPGFLAPEVQRHDVVFEGAQGVLLDETWGFHPYLTPSTCTFANADALLDTWGFAGTRRRIGVLRTYHVRHGPGPLPTETPTLDVLDEPHNPSGPWQGRFRRGHFDCELARRALAIVGGIDALALTHVDALAHSLDWRVATGYRHPLPAPTQDPNGGFSDDLDRVQPLFTPLGGHDLPTRTRALFAVLASHLGLEPTITAHGPRASDVLG